MPEGRFRAPLRPSLDPQMLVTKLVAGDHVTALVGVLPPTLLTHLASVRTSVLTCEGQQRFVAGHSRHELRIGKSVIDLKSWDAQQFSYAARGLTMRDSEARPAFARISHLRRM